MDTPDPQFLSLQESRLELVPKGNRQRRLKPGGRFLKGPIPWEWVTRAAQLAGRALHVGIALWFLSGLQSNRTVTLSSSTLAELGVGRRTGYRAIEALEGAGLVAVERHVGRSPRVTILDVSKKNQPDNAISPRSRSTEENAAA